MKYEGSNPLAKLHLDEPYFFIRAQDALAVKAVLAYANLLGAASVNHAEKIDFQTAKRLIHQELEVKSIAQAIEDWQALNPQLVKLPD